MSSTWSCPARSQRMILPTPSMWPVTKCPPNSPSARNGRSRFTSEPGLANCRLVRRHVSWSRSNWASLNYPREVFADALADRASGVIVAHNHPSGQLEPSTGDVNITAQLKAAGAIVGIELLDHIIFNRTGHFSFLEGGRL